MCKVLLVPLCFALIVATLGLATIGTDPTTAKPVKATPVANIKSASDQPSADLAIVVSATESVSGDKAESDHARVPRLIGVLESPGPVVVAQLQKRLIPAPTDEKPAAGEIPKSPPKDVLDEPPSSKLAFQALAVDAKAPGIEIVPDRIAIASTKRFQIVTVRTDGKVKWMVFNRGKEPVEWLQLPGTKSIQVFPTYGVDDEITVYAYTVVGGDPTDPVKSVIIVGKKADDRKPPTGDVENPDDKKLPKSDGKMVLHITIVTDEALAKSNSPLAVLIAGKDLRSGVESRGHKLWVMDQKKDVDKIKERGFDEFLRKIAKIPLFVVQDGTGAVVDSGPLPMTLVALLQRLDGLVPPKSGE